MSLGKPTWINDPYFYVGNHVQRVQLPYPGTEEQLTELIGRLLSSPLDRSKPLWEVFLIEGYTDATPIFFKVHHCMVDGLAAVELFTLLMDMTPEYTPPPRKPLYAPAPLPSNMQLMFDSFGRDVNQGFQMLQKLGKDLSRMGQAFIEPEKRLKAMIATAHLINGNMQPIKKLPINGTNTGRQMMVWAEFPLADVHAIRATKHASVNDVMLTTLSATIERFILQVGGNLTDQRFVRMLMPVSVRIEEEKSDYGNRISVLPVDIPFGVANPLERLEAVKNFTQVMKESSLTQAMDTLLTVPILLPSAMQPLIWNAAPLLFSLLAHSWCTNVAAAPLPIYLMGHELKHVYGFFPLNPSMGLAAVIVSYNGRISMTLVVDTGIIHDVDMLRTDLYESFNELRQAAGLPDVESPAPTLTAPNTSAQPVTPPVAKIEPHHTVEPTTSEVSTNGKEATPAATPTPAPISETAKPSSAAAPARIPIALNKSPVTAAPPPATERYKLFSEEWAQAVKEVINNSPAYKNASTNWTAGSLAFVMQAAPNHGFATPAAVYLDLHKGDCRQAKAMTEAEAMKSASFVIQGDYSAWIEALSGKSSPLAMLSTGRLRLKKGSMFALLPHTRSANELVKCAQKVPYIPS
jgi:WS/DGAT/MGAT family acyltransferase